MQQSLPRREVVLLGAGHTNAHILRMWKMNAAPDIGLTCVSNFPIATYSGMLPAVLAGQHTPDRMTIDLARLCPAVGARLIVADVNGIDLTENRLLFSNRPSIAFDVLSIGVGSVPVPPAQNTGERLIRIKPMQTFLPRLDARLAELVRTATDRSIQICVVGAGIAGVEVTLCMIARLTSQLKSNQFQITLVNGSNRIAHGTLPRTQTLVRRTLLQRGVSLRLGSRVVQVDSSGARLESGETVDADVVLWATGATAPPVLRHFDQFEKDEQGFLKTHSTLQVVGDHPVFAVGDTGTMEGTDLPKAGVYAVRQGPVLWRNLHNILNDRPLENYRPQSDFLKLLNTGDGRAIAEYKGLSVHSRLAWRLKDRIDCRFMDKYQDYTPMEMKSGPSVDPAITMRCTGCGSKVAGSVLSKVLQRLNVPPNENVVLGLEEPDDAAIIRSIANQPTTVTVDFFSAPLDDPYLVGRIATLNAASDLFAMGTSPVAALAMATIPTGSARRQEELLFQMLSGSIEELSRMGATLVGGHTTEGPQTLIGFTMLANTIGDRPSTKKQLQPGDALVLTKPLGTGALLAAHMRAQCQADWWQSMITTMLLSNQQPADHAIQLGLDGITDITGFGLAGHLLEMLKASGVSCQISLQQLPVLPGALEIINDGIESTLAPANRDVEALLKVEEEARRDTRYSLLFDPQTSGGLLIAVPDAKQACLMDRLGSTAAIIGHVTQSTDDLRILAVTV